MVVARSDGRSANVDALEEIDTTNLIVGRDEPGHLGGIRNFFLLGEQLALGIPLLVEGVGDFGLTDGEPLAVDLVVAGERLLRIPSAHLGVEQAGLAGANLQQ